MAENALMCPACGATWLYTEASRKSALEQLDAHRLRLHGSENQHISEPK